MRSYHYHDAVLLLNLLSEWLDRFPRLVKLFEAADGSVPGADFEVDDRGDDVAVNAAGEMTVILGEFGEHVQELEELVRKRREPWEERAESESVVVGHPMDPAGGDR